MQQCEIKSKKVNPSKGSEVSHGSKIDTEPVTRLINLLNIPKIQTVKFSIKILALYLSMRFKLLFY